LWSATLFGKSLSAAPIFQTTIHQIFDSHGAPSIDNSGLPDFFGTTYQNGGKYTKLP
jgi:hypothetical protein